MPKSIQVSYNMYQLKKLTQKGMNTCLACDKSLHMFEHIRIFLCWFFGEGGGDGIFVTISHYNLIDEDLKIQGKN